MLNKDLYERYLQKKAKKLGISVEELKGESKPQNEPAPQKNPEPVFQQPQEQVFQQSFEQVSEKPVEQVLPEPVVDRRENKFCVIGYPLGHSLSSVIHKAGFQSLGIQASYETIETAPEDLVERIKYLKNNNYKGFNVTIPLKLPVALFVDEVDKLIIYVEGDILTKLPQTKINLPSTLDRNFGINKTYDFTKTDDINQVTVYYLNKHNDNYYYVPVTKYLNDNRDKIKIIIDELTSTNTYNTNLLSYLNSNTEILAIEEQPDILELTFNSYIFSDVESKDILEEVIYTICLSVKDNYDVSEVVIKSEDEEIYQAVLKEIE